MTSDTVGRALGAVRLGDGIRPSGHTLAWTAGVALAAVAGTAAAIAPVPAVLGVGGVAAATAVLAAGRRTQRGFLLLLAGLLVGYAFANRGFAYLGVRPVFVGEVVLAVGVLAFLRALPHARFGLVSAFILLFMAWGALRTIPFLGADGIDAVRDGVVWEYAAFALFVGSFASFRDAEAITRLYGRLVPIFLVWVPIGAVLHFAGAVPMLPGTSVPLIGFQRGDMGVQLAGVAAFMLTGLYATTPGRRTISESFAWLGWFISAAIVAAQTRGAMLAMAMCGVAVLLARPSVRWVRALLVASAILGVALVVNPTVDVGQSRPLSVSQLVSNMTSVFDDSGNENLDDSKRWRLEWWSTIVDYTFDGPYFWTGKGFGINLADADGFQVGDVGVESSLRAPHNGHLNILARTGVPGLTLWVSLNTVWLLTMLRALFRARRAGDERRAAIIVWLIVIWAAALVNASFDVYLEGPHGGIWYWSVVGLGIAVARGAPSESGFREDAPEPADQLSALNVRP